MVRVERLYQLHKLLDVLLLLVHGQVNSEYIFQKLLEFSILSQWTEVVGAFDLSMDAFSNSFQTVLEGGTRRYKFMNVLITACVGQL